jgi:hypothetical protein
VKLLNPNGSVSIYTTPTGFRRIATGDPWPSHAVDLSYFSAQQTASGEGFIYIVFELVDGSVWYYTYFATSTLEEVEAIFAARFEWMKAHGYDDAYGEWFNYAIRPNLKHKFTSDEFFEYLSS